MVKWGMDPKVGDTRMFLLEAKNAKETSSFVFVIS